MLNRIHLKNFRKHTDTELTFNGGLSVLRAPNEHGKTTLIEAVCYALFGVKALRSPLEDTVTWGEPVNTLKVELDIAVDGVSYSIKRGKSGAEVNYDGGRVTGQGEATSFICSKLKVDPVSATKLMLAGQGEIRGALEAGTKATTELIERLAEFDQLDNLLEIMQERLTLGSAVGAEAALKEAEQHLQDLQVKAVEPDIGALQAAIATAQAQMAAAAKGLEALEGEAQAAQTALDEARIAQTAHQVAATKLEGLQAKVELLGAQIEEARKEASVELVGPSEEDLRAQIETLANAATHLQAYSRLQPYLTAPKAQVEGLDFNELKARLAKLGEEHAALMAASTRAAGDIQVAKAGLSFGNCGFCGQDFSHLPQVAEKNAALQRTIDAAQETLTTSKAAIEALRKEQDLLNAIEADSRGRFATLSANPIYVQRSGTSLPPVLVWAGPDIDSLNGAEEALAQARKDLKQVQSAVARVQTAQARHTALLEQRAALEAEVELATAEVSSAYLQLRDLGAAQARREAVLAQRRPLQAQASESQSALRDAEYELRDAQRTYTQALAAVEQAQVAVQRRKEALEALAFNNALLKRVRQARPLIADKLWGIVLAAVSSYFSEMRGARSSVTKDSEGFKVDGHPISALSGSTLDILGLAIRVALVRTFLPTAPFLVLDEPCSAMDQRRTESTLGFVVACGFKQVLLVTHEETSESIADHMIEL